MGLPAGRAEGRWVNLLRESDGAVVSMVAVDEAPAWQHRGVGSRLVRRGVAGKVRYPEAFRVVGAQRASAR